VLILFAVVAITIVVGFGAGFLATIARENIPITSELPLLGPLPQALHRQAVTIPPEPTLSQQESNPPQTIEETHSPQSAAPVSPDHETHSSPEATLKGANEQNGLIEDVIPGDSNAVPAPENTQHQNQRDQRIRFLRAQEARIEQQLNNPDLSPSQRRLLERRKAYWTRALKRALAGP
jgi:hypothetical protein